jgi:cell division protein FtsQ
MKRNTKQKQKKEQKKGIFSTTWKVTQVCGLFVVKLSFFAVLLVLISVSLIAGYRFILSSPYLLLKQVEIRGVDTTIQNDLMRLGGLQSEISLLALNLSHIKQMMQQHPWIQSVQLERRFPHTLIVYAEKEIPWAAVVMDKLYYLNRNGKVFKEITEQGEIDLPVITGLRDLGPKGLQALTRAGQIMETLVMAKEPWSWEALSEIHFKENDNTSIYFEHLHTEIKIAPETIDIRKVEVLDRVVKHLTQTGRLNQVSGIDLRYMNDALVSFKSG